MSYYKICVFNDSFPLISIMQSPGRSYYTSTLIILRTSSRVVHNSVIPAGLITDRYQSGSLFAYVLFKVVGNAVLTNLLVEIVLFVLYTSRQTNHSHSEIRY